ncbi:MAG TPA: hypothetical protein PLF26_08405 [Blastocatellia bacterium]|nr:hypothetical protein [Blastocatellia bacterium]
MKLEAHIDGAIRGVEIDLDGSAFRLRVDGRDVTGDVRLPEAGVYTFYVGSRVIEARVSRLAADNTVRVQIGAETAEVLIVDPKRRRPGSHGSSEGEQTLVAPMPGKVVALLANVGDEVAIGQGVIVVEAMKMQNEVKAAKAGVVAEIRAAVGDTVNAGQVLATIM